MAHFSSIEVREMLRGIEEKRAVCVSGPARSGLSRWTSDFVTERLGSPVAIDGSSLSSPEELARLLRLTESGELLSPSQARAAHQTTDNSSIIWISNFHLVPPIVRVILARYLFTREGITPTHKAVVVEGAVDFESLINDAFPEGVSTGPVVALAEEGYPWRSLTEISDLAAEVAPKLPPLVIPWIVDFTGGDLGLAREAVTLLRVLDPDDVDGKALFTTWNQVVERSAVARSIKSSAGAIVRGDAFEAILAGRVVSGDHITRCEDPELRSLFFAGLISYDRSARGYRVRGPVTALILLRLKDANVQSLSQLYERAAIGARTAVVLLELARLELQLRATLVAKTWASHAADVSTPSQWGNAGKRAADAINKCEQGTKEIRVEIAKLVKASLPEDRPVLEAAKERAKGKASDDQLLDYLGLAEIVGVAAKLGVLAGDLRTQLDTALVGVRNALAHFRGLDYDAAVAAVRVSTKVLRHLIGVLGASSAVDSVPAASRAVGATPSAPTPESPLPAVHGLSTASAVASTPTANAARTSQIPVDSASSATPTESAPLRGVGDYTSPANSSGRMDGLNATGVATTDTVAPEPATPPVAAVSGSSVSTDTAEPAPTSATSKEVVQGETVVDTPDSGRNR